MKEGNRKKMSDSLMSWAVISFSASPQYVADLIWDVAFAFTKSMEIL